MNEKPDKSLPLIIAHRGESHEAPENTLASINHAWKKNDDAVEIDIHLTADDKIVVIHDSTTGRTGNVNLKIKKSLCDDLKKVDVGKFKDPKWKGEKIPLLSEVLQTIPSNGKLIVEIKCDNKIIPFLQEELLKFKGKNDQIQIIGFNRQLVTEVKRIMPQYKVLWLLNLDYNWLNRLFSLNGQSLLRKTKNAGLDGVDAFAGRLLTDSFINKAKSMNLLVYAWTVDDPELAVRLAEMKIDGITTNRCQWIKTILTEHVANKNNQNK